MINSNASFLELYNIQRAYYSGDYERVLETKPATFSDANVVNAQVLIARAKIALGQQKDVIDEYNSLSEDDADLLAVVALAKYSLGKKEEAVSAIESLIAESGDNHTVQYLGGIILVSEDRLDEAIELLDRDNNLEAATLLVEIYLIQNHVEAAYRKVKAVSAWAQDNIAFNLAESWAFFRKGGFDRYQDGFYIYDELCTGGTITIKSLLGKIVSQLLLGRLPEAENIVSQALTLDPEQPDALISAISFAILSGASYEEFEE